MRPMTNAKVERRGQKAKRKRRNPEKILERKALKEWAQLIRKRAENKCEWCSQEGPYLNCHHIIGKRFKPLRYTVGNGILLCPRCHKWGIGYAAHENPVKIVDWLSENRPIALELLRKFNELKKV